MRSITNHPWNHRVKFAINSESEFAIPKPQNLQMTRGAQRDRERERAQKKAGQKATAGNKEGLSAVQRKERDAQIMRDKQKAKADAAEAAAAGK